MKKIMALVGTFVIVISFQNCGQPNLNSDVPGSSMTVGKGISANETPARDVQKVVLWDPEHQQFLDVSLQDGVMTAYEEYGQVRSGKYCLSTAELQELKNLMTYSTICEPQIDPELMKDRMCTMLYTYPYATLVKDNEEYRLGEIKNGCDVPPVDLCGDQASMLKGFATAVIKSLPAKACQ